MKELKGKVILEERVDDETLLLKVSRDSFGQPYVSCPEYPDEVSHKVYTRLWNQRQDREKGILNGRGCSKCGRVYSVRELLDLNST